jgi:hypothetical protein
LNPLHSSLKYPIQFFPIDIPHNRWQGFKRLVFVSHLSPFELSFIVGKKQKSLKLDPANRVAVAVAVACGICHIIRANLLKPDLCELSNSRDESQVSFDAASFLEERSLVRMG